MPKKLTEEKIKEQKEKEVMNKLLDNLMGVKLAILIPDNFPMEYKQFRRSLCKIIKTISRFSYAVMWREYYRNGEQEPSLDKRFVFKIIESNHFRLDLRRDAMIMSAMKWGATHMLCLDTDQNFTEDVFFRLFRHNKPLVAGLYFHKIPPYLPHLYTRDKNFAKKQSYNIPTGYPSLDPTKPLIDKAILYYKKDGKTKEKEVEIHATGAGCLLIRREVIEALKKPPYFKFKEHYDDKGEKRKDTYETEDLYFFDRIKDETNYKLWIDTSCKCGHLAPNKEITEQTFLAYGQINPLIKSLT